MTITGTNFAAGATVTFGSTAATNVVVVSGTQITATTPAGSAGAVTVTVTVSGQSGSLASAIHLRSDADGEQRQSEYWDDGGRDGRDDHRHELCCRSDGNVRQYGSDERSGGERDADHGDHSGSGVRAR